MREMSLKLGTRGDRCRRAEAGRRGRRHRRHLGPDPEAADAHDRQRTGCSRAPSPRPSTSTPTGRPKRSRRWTAIATDDHAQFRYYRELGYFQQTPEPYADLGELVTGRKPGRQSPAERTMAMNLGLALDDMAVAPEVLRRAQRAGLGTWLPL